VELVGNIFETKQICRNYLQMIVNKFAKEH